MRETAADLDRLQALLDESVTKASPFLRGRFYVPTVAQAARARHPARRPGVSVTYYEGRTMAIIAHGRAEAVATGEESFDEIERSASPRGGESLLGWSGDPIFLRVEPDVIYTYAKEL